MSRIEWSNLPETHLASALCYAACQRGHRVLFSTAINVVNQLHAAHSDGTFLRRLRSYLAPDVLCLGELGYLPIDRHRADLLFQVISGRHERGSVVLTTITVERLNAQYDGSPRWGHAPESSRRSEAATSCTPSRLVSKASTNCRWTSGGTAGQAASSRSPASRARGMLESSAPVPGPMRARTSMGAWLWGDASSDTGLSRKQSHQQARSAS